MNQPARYVKKPAVIEAIEFDGTSDSFVAIFDFLAKPIDQTSELTAEEIEMVKED